jgi:hypothetical protein
MGVATFLALALLMPPSTFVLREDVATLSRLFRRTVCVPRDQIARFVLQSPAEGGGPLGSIVIVVASGDRLRVDSFAVKEVRDADALVALLETWRVTGRITT